MVTAIVPQFLMASIADTLKYYQTSLGFEQQFEYGDPVFYAGSIRDGFSIFFRLVDEPLTRNPAKYELEHLDAYIFEDDIDGQFAAYKERGVTFHREIETMPWGFREFVVKDCDGRLLCFGKSSEAFENE